MKCMTRLAAALALAALAAGPAAAQGLQVPVEYHKLDNGLKVVISRDATAPTAVVAVYYNIGFRIEPRDRTGFAHLFEHMMFQASENLGKMEFARLVQSNGGVFNGSTRFDFTNYFEIVPAHVVETVLWAEADRMKGLAITQENLTNQQGVVTNEVKVNVLNQPYGGFPWLDMPQYANVNWHNAHNFYGDLKDLEAATLQDVKTFFEKYYAPSNAVVVVVGDVDPAQTLGWIQKYFGPLPKRPTPVQPDISEPRQDKEKRATKPDPLATRPALAVSWHMPVRNTPEYYAMGLVNKILVQGKDSRLYQALVQEKGLTGRRRRRHQPARRPVQHLGSHRPRRVPLPRQGQERGPDPGDDRRRGGEAAERAGGRGHARPGHGEDAVIPLRRGGRFLRLRPRRPPRLLRALRRRPVEDQPPGGGVRQGHARADPEGGEGVPALDEPHGPPDRSQEGRRRRLSMPLPTPRRRKAEASDEGPHRRPHPGPAGPRGGAVRRPRARQGHASAARRAEGLQAARAGAPDPPERDEGHAGRLGQHAQGRAGAVHPGRQCPRDGRPGLAGRSHGRAPSRRYEDAQRQADRGGGREDGRLPRGRRGRRHDRGHDRRALGVRAPGRPPGGRRGAQPRVPGAGAGPAEGGQAPRPFHRQEHAAADRAREVPRPCSIPATPTAACSRRRPRSRPTRWIR